MSEMRDTHETLGRLIRRAESRERLSARKIESMTTALRVARLILAAADEDTLALIDEALGFDVDAELREEEEVA